MATLQASPGFQISAQSGTNYVADPAGVITGVASNDVASLVSGGCQLIGVGSPTLIGRLLGANMNSTADQAIPMFNGSLPYRVTKISIKNASVSLTAAQGSIYTAASKGGTAMTATPTTTPYTTLTSSALAMELTITTTPAATVWAATTPLFLSLTTAQGAAATADIFVFGDLAQ